MTEQRHAANLPATAIDLSAGKLAASVNMGNFEAQIQLT
jgi:hypothetical protein